MHYLSTSCLVLFFIFSLFHHLRCASSKKQLGWCESLFQCGNVTAGFPFSGGNRPRVCGHPLLELRCINNITSLFISDQEFYVLQINQSSNTLVLARTDLFGYFCSSTFTNTTLPPEIFELSPTYKSINVFYLCDLKLPYLSNYTCPEIGNISVSENPVHQNTCRKSFTVNLPTSLLREEKELNLKDLESVLRQGFEVKVKIDEKACQECSSSHEFCGFDETLPFGVKCGPLYSPDGGTKGGLLYLPDGLTKIRKKRKLLKETNQSYVFSAYELLRVCSSPFSCGDQEDLFYPFWIPGREECGHPDFKLECNTSFAEVSISSVKFRILKATRRSRIIKLARLDYINNLCPQNPLNAPFDENVISFAPDTDMLTIYYECRQVLSPNASIYVGELSCKDYVKSYYVTRNLSSPLLREVSGLLNDFRGTCRRNVSIPSSRTALNTLERTPTLDNMKKALEEGFKLGLNQDCSMCLNSGGACGYNMISSRFVCYCEGCHKGISFTKKIVGMCLSANICLRNTSDNLRQQNLKALIPLKHYSYAKVKKITKSFAEVVGKGGFGTVYKGTLCDGRSVAVKVLKESKGNGEDFINEVASMSKTSHVNIVSLLGFCSEGSKRAILYEFVENGSLDKFISTKMDWMVLYGIALGIARGLEYLHYGCNTRIVHFDIKPSNILLDKNLCPKVSDFGLAKLCKKKESIMSMVDTRGTVGYIAPEMISRIYGSVSHKSDVYSYGMLVLEMIGARNKTSTETSASNTSSVYFPELIYKDLEKGDDRRLIENEIGIEEDEIEKKMTLVGLWCIQSSPSDRPSMNRVVEMMEGNLDALKVPPKPVLQISAAPLQESSILSEDISAYT